MFKNQKILSYVALILGSFAPAALLHAQTTTKLTLQFDQPGASVSPRLYGLMTEEINYSYDGGIYGELLRNRSFKDNQKAPDHWRLLKEKGDTSAIMLDYKNPVNDALTTSLHLQVAAGDKKTGIANDGFWGIPVKPSTTYKGSFFARAGQVNNSTLTVSIEDTVTNVAYASAIVTGIDNGWKKFSVSLTVPATVKPTSATRFVIRPNAAGSYWFSLVSLFPPTFNNRPNGNRADIMQLLASMNPAFLRLPGGNYLEGEMFSTRFDWKKTLGPVEGRPGHKGTWGYRSSDGMGLLEYLLWCEDLHMEPVLALFAGYTLNTDHIEAGPLLKPFVDDALEEIEYVTGDTTTVWGKRRALDGHPAPFKLNFVEVGNEDGFDLSGSYDGRFAQFFDAIRAKYPELQVISTVGGKDWLGQRVPLTKRRPDVYDEHYYRSAFDMESDADHYDKYDRKGPKIFVGEWATREGKPTPNFNAALGDAAWMTGMERNSDIVVMSCYAPLFVNVNPGGMQWSSDLIGYNTLNSYGSPSFYAQQMFNNYKGDKVVNITGEGIPTQLQRLSHKDSVSNVKPKTYPSLFYVGTRDSRTGTLYLKVVNAAGSAAPVSFNFNGAGTLKSNGKIVVLKAEKPEDTNSITEPKKIVPVTSVLKGIKKDFNYTFPAYSISVLQIEAK
ncbi:alpha-L-arabinofuranosidase C-terminal domain-containing protein [Mucilaginibacter sp. cycad4]|uniref:alpha-L-arabinofuranosidase C-terminal domain-containing protein n=1 Tax=Mucilaginibacter sp. cycad4 TaxID=3342096 RepID=UPI002AAAA17B|nr:alpha-L-arabinofuranosidase C-terminal domain-containing protein [Mucilaginibacter gossypii]WPU97501.1 alpha-L-arabinofuranosidase C-terminal domain-containing protein [Mucilaginibacter gossypii]